MNTSTLLQNVSNDDILSYVCVCVIGVFVVIAKPENTSPFFGHPAVKALLFVIVAAVVYTDLKLGVLFGLAMLMTIVYSQMVRTSPMPPEMFAGFEQAPESPAGVENPAGGDGDQDQGPDLHADQGPDLDADQGPDLDADQGPDLHADQGPGGDEGGDQGGDEGGDPFVTESFSGDMQLEGYSPANSNLLSTYDS
jgi:hypothetical protein